MTAATALERPTPWRERFIVEVRRRSPEQRRSLYRLSGLLIVVGAVGSTVLLVGVTTHSGPELLDRPVERWFLTLREASTTPVMIVLAVVFGPIGMPILVAVVLIVWIALTRHLWRPILLFCGMTSGVVLAQVLAPIVRHPRPPVATMLFGADHTFSFPSGHVLGMSDFFLLTAFLLASRISRPPVTALFTGVAVVAILSQVFSRLYLGYHWFSDVTGSLALSLVIVGIVIAIDTRRTVRVADEPLPGAMSAPQRDGT
ncbi:phosphatase PAP2 family protein [Pseudolysinimonas sp.]|uniref:phosphatase PAP2 family protein n=1 Tax=Pseudolysinimonas sp. TaxID=2680009 RepID=UPI003F7FD971